MARERSRRVPAPRLKWCGVKAVKERSDLAGRLPRYLKTRELQVFLAVAESHSIAEAARRLSLTQPAVSKCINELENTLGVALFERDSRGISPTRYGEVLSRRAHSIFGEIRLAGEEISQLKGADSGKVSIGVMPVAAGGFAAAAVADLMTSHPGVCVSILEGDHEMLFEALRNRQIDLVVGRLPADLSASDLDRTALPRPAVRSRPPYASTDTAQDHRTGRTRRRILRYSQVTFARLPATHQVLPAQQGALSAQAG